MSSADRIPSCRDRNYSGKPIRAKPSKTRYLYDADNEVSSHVSTEESVVALRFLAGRDTAMEDERSEVTDRMHNLSSVKHGRRYPKHHSVYRQNQEHPWHHEKRVRFQADNELPSSVDWMSHDDSMNSYDAQVLSDEDSEYPTNSSHSSETRSTACSSNDDDDHQVRNLLRGDCSSCEEVDEESDNVSTGTCSRPKHPLLMLCLSSISSLSRFLFLLGCLLTLSMATYSLSLAKEQERNVKHSHWPSNQTFNAQLRKLSINASDTELAHQPLRGGHENWTHLQQDEHAHAGNEHGLDEEYRDHDDAVSSDNIEWDEPTEDKVEVPQESGIVKPVAGHSQNETKESQDGLQDALPPMQVDLNSAAPGTSTNPDSEDSSSATTSPQMSVSLQKDKVIFTFGGGAIKVTQYMILSFAAALCFAIVGFVEWVLHDYLFHLLLGIAGVWGLLAALFIQRNPGTAVGFHALSVHCFLGAALSVLWLRFGQSAMPAQSRSSRAASQTRGEGLLLADICFAVGAAMAVVSSYMTMAYGFHEAALMVDVQRFDVFSAILWVACAILYLCCTAKATIDEVN